MNNKSAPKILFFISLFFMHLQSFAQHNDTSEWGIDVTVTVNGVQENLQFGAKEGATDDFDNYPIDLLAPPPGPTGIYAYFYIDAINGVTTHLTEDYRSNQKSTHSWTLYIANTLEMPGMIEWDTTEFPEGSHLSGSLEIEGVDMLSQSSLAFEGDQVYSITCTTPQDLDTLYAEINVFLQGPFDSTGSLMKSTLKPSIPLQSPYDRDRIDVSHIPVGVVDWICMDLLSMETKEPLYSKSLFLLQNGNTVDPGSMSFPAFFLGVPDSYYLSITHRNHFSAVSASALMFSVHDTLYYDFTNSASNYSSDSKHTLLNPNPSIYGLRAGDANADGIINTKDYVAWYNAQRANLTGYQICDFNFDGAVDNQDFLLWLENASKN